MTSFFLKCHLNCVVNLFFLLSFNIYPWLLPETRDERGSTDETKALNLSNSQFRVQHLGQRTRDQEPRLAQPAAHIGNPQWITR